MRETSGAKILRVIMCGYVLAMVIFAFLSGIYAVVWENKLSPFGTSARDRAYLDGVDYLRE